jgi:hypothetical protein
MSQRDQHSSSFNKCTKSSSYIFDLRLVQSSTLNSTSIMTAFPNVLRRQKAQSSLMSLDFVDNEDLISSTRLCDDLIETNRIALKCKKTRKSRSSATQSSKKKRLSSHSRPKPIRNHHKHAKQADTRSLSTKDFLYKLVESDNYDVSEHSDLETKNEFNKYGDFVVWYV